MKTRKKTKPSKKLPTTLGPVKVQDDAGFLLEEYNAAAKLVDRDLRKQRVKAAFVGLFFLAIVSGYVVLTKTIVTGITEVVYSSLEAGHGLEK